MCFYCYLLFAYLIYFANHQNICLLFSKVLISKSCSEEGLEDATDLLLQLSQANNATRNTILALLLDGARQLAQTVCQHIR